MGGVPMSNGENMFMGALLGLAFMCWTWLVFDLGSYSSGEQHPTQETCEAELRRSESCEQVWVKE